MVGRRPSEDTQRNVVERSPAATLDGPGALPEHNGLGSPPGLPSCPVGAVETSFVGVGLGQGPASGTQPCCVDTPGLGCLSSLRHDKVA